MAVTSRDTSRVVGNIKNRQILEERRGEVVATATRLFGARGYSNVSVNQVASEAGISIGSLYKYIRRKEDLLWLVVDEIYLQHEQALERVRFDSAASATVRLLTYMRAYVTSRHHARRNVLLIYREFGHLSRRAQQEFIERERHVLDAVNDIILDGVDAGEFRAVDARMAALNAIMIASTWVLKGYFLTGMSIEDYLRSQLDLLLRTLGIGQELVAPR